MAKDITETLEKRVADLQAELDKATRQLADAGHDVYDDARAGGKKLVATVNRHAQDAYDEAQSEISAVAQTAKENPVVTTVLLVGVAAAGFALGLLTASAQEDRHRGWW